MNLTCNWNPRAYRWSAASGSCRPGPHLMGGGRSHSATRSGSVHPPRGAVWAAPAAPLHRPRGHPPLTAAARRFQHHTRPRPLPRAHRQSRSVFLFPIALSLPSLGVDEASSCSPARLAAISLRPDPPPPHPTRHHGRCLCHRRRPARPGARPAGRCRRRHPAGARPAGGRPLHPPLPPVGAAHGRGGRRRRGGC